MARWPRIQRQRFPESWPVEKFLRMKYSQGKKAYRISLLPPTLPPLSLRINAMATRKFCWGKGGKPGWAFSKHKSGDSVWYTFFSGISVQKDNSNSNKTKGGKKIKPTTTENLGSRRPRLTSCLWEERVSQAWVEIPTTCPASTSTRCWVTGWKGLGRGSCPSCSWKLLFLECMA